VTAVFRGIFDTPVVTGSTELARYTVAHTNAAAHGENPGPLCDFFRHGESVMAAGRPAARRPPLSGNRDEYRAAG